MVTKFADNLFEPGDSIVVGVSGGIDSVALLDMLSKSENALVITIAHVNYGFRGKESDRDEKFVRELAKKYSCQFKLAKPKNLKAEADNLQSAARDYRYEFFKKVARKVGADKIVLGHHADDQAETILLHLTRGSGLSGLTGMSEKRELEPGLFLVRPMLNFTRKEIADYAKKQKLTFVEDSTNNTNHYQRNIVRHNLLPLLAKHNSSIVEHLCKTAEILKDEDEVLKMLACNVIDKICQNPPPLFFYKGGQGGLLVEFNAADFNKYHIAIRRRILREIYRKITGDTADLLMDHIEKMLQIADSTVKNGKYNLPGGLKFERQDMRIFIKY